MWGGLHDAAARFVLTRPEESEARRMSIFAWVILGLVSGFIASGIVNRRGAGALPDIALGIVGAVVGGALSNLFGAAGVTGLNLWSMCVSVCGAVVVLAAYHALTRGRPLA
jgi:uncharacterized membrane protein YeaQ/YmgE (transglycosylase-associated protein family)